jgi:hypothetical protein
MVLLGGGGVEVEVWILTLFPVMSHDQVIALAMRFSTKGDAAGH